MTEQDKPETIPEQARQALAGLAKAAHDIERELTAADRQEAREDERLSLYRREAEQALIVRAEQHEAHLRDVAHLQAHREQVEEIARENTKSLASIAESLQTIAKAILEEARR